MEHLQWVANFGFAAVVAVFLLVRTDRSVQGLTKAVTLNTIVLARASGQDYEEVRRQFNGGNGGGAGG